MSGVRRRPPTRATPAKEVQTAATPAKEVQIGAMPESSPIDLTKFFNTAELSDIAIKFHEREMKCHKSILCAASDYFKTLCGAKFKEADQKTIELKDDEDPDSVEAMLSYLYSFEYTEKFKARANEATFHFNVLITANKYLVPRLFEKALAAFKSSVSSLDRNAEGAWALIKLDAKYPDQHAAISQAVKELKKQHLRYLIMKPDLNMILPNDKDLHRLISDKFETNLTKMSTVACCNRVIYAVDFCPTAQLRCQDCSAILISNGQVSRGVKVRDMWASNT